MPNADGWGVIQDWGNRQAVKSGSMFRRFLRVQLRTAGQKPYMEVGPAPKDNRGKWKSCACWLAGFSLISGAGGDILIEMYVALINRTKAAWRMVNGKIPWPSLACRPSGTKQISGKRKTLRHVNSNQEQGKSRDQIPDSLLRNAFGQAITITIPTQMRTYGGKYLFAILCRLQPRRLRFISVWVAPTLSS